MGEEGGFGVVLLIYFFHIGEKLIVCCISFD